MTASMKLTAGIDSLPSVHEFVTEQRRVEKKMREVRKSYRKDPITLYQLTRHPKYATR